MDRRLIIEHIPRLRRYARALVGDRYVADGLVQDTLERAWNKFYLWRPGSDLRAWLFTIMHNVFVNQARRRRYEIEQATDELPAIAVRATQGEQLELQDVDRVLRSLSAQDVDRAESALEEVARAARRSRSSRAIRSPSRSWPSSCGCSSTTGTCSAATGCRTRCRARKSGADAISITSACPSFPGKKRLRRSLRKPR